MASLSEVDICNLALGWCGANLITSLDDVATEAQLCKTNYESLRRAELSVHEWTFAQARLVLAPDVTPPAWGYAVQFQLPDDCLKVSYLGRSDRFDETEPFDQWVKEGTKVLVDQTTNIAYLRYTVDLVDISKMSEPFIHAFAARLAMDLAMPLAHSASLQGAMTKLYGAKLGIALPADQMQGRTRVTRATGIQAARRSGAPLIGPTV